MNKITKIFFALLITLSFAACNNEENNNANNSDNSNQGNNQSSVDIKANSTLKDFEGKVSAIYFGATTCPHCVNGAPVFKAKVYDQYKDRINAWVNVVNGQNGDQFEVSEIPQGFNKNLVFDNIVGEECGYVPSWVLLDQAGKLILSSCGSEKTIEEMIAGIQELLK